MMKVLDFYEGCATILAKRGQAPIERSHVLAQERLLRWMNPQKALEAARWAKLHVNAGRRRDAQIKSFAEAKMLQVLNQALETVLFSDDPSKVL